MDPDQIYMYSVFKKCINLGSAGAGLKGYNYCVCMIAVGMMCILWVGVGGLASLFPYVI